MSSGVRVFISYSHEDAAFVARLKTALRNAGADIWIDHERLRPGTSDWDAAIRDGIAQANYVVYIASPSARRSPYVRDELSIARDLGRHIIPIWADGRSWSDSVPLGMGTTQYIDARSSRYKDALATLLDALEIRAVPQTVKQAPSAPIAPNGSSAPPATSTPAPAGSGVQLQSTKQAVEIQPSIAPLPSTNASPRVEQHAARPAPGSPPRSRAQNEPKLKLTRRVLTVAVAISIVAAMSLALLLKVHPAATATNHGHSPTATTGSRAPSSTIQWKTNVGSAAYSSPIVSDGFLYIGSEDGNMYALNAASGTIRWKAAIGGNNATPAVSNGLVYIDTQNSDHSNDVAYVYALQSDSGAVRWRYTMPISTNSSPVVSNGVVYVGATFEDSAGYAEYGMFAFNGNTGAILWKAPIQPTGTPAVSNGTIYFSAAGSAEDLYALDAKSGTTRWSKTVGVEGSSPTVSNGVVYVGSNDGKVYALNAASGDVRWSTPTGGPVNSSPIVSAGVVFVGSADGNIYALNASTGTIRWKFPTHGAVISTPTVSNEVVYVGSNDGKVYALDAVSGAVRWETPTGGAVRSSPAIAGDLVYVGSSDGSVYAIQA